MTVILSILASHENAETIKTLAGRRKLHFSLDFDVDLNCLLLSYYAYHAASPKTLVHCIGARFLQGDTEIYSV